MSLLCRERFGLPVEHRSTGLGLSIVKRMVEAMNFKVWCESEPGRGATFIVALPVGNP